MAAEIFDTLSVSKRLMDGGLSREASEGIAEVLKDTITTQLATKKDLEALRKDILLTVGGMLAVAVTILLAALPLLINR